eukprot:2619475-Amphidinium_carterae.1
MAHTLVETLQVYEDGAHGAPNTKMSLSNELMRPGSPLTASGRNPPMRSPGKVPLPPTHNRQAQLGPAPQDRARQPNRPGQQDDLCRHLPGNLLTTLDYPDQVHELAKERVRQPAHSMQIESFSAPFLPWATPAKDHTRHHII